MSKMEIRIYGDPVLSEVAKPIEKITERHRALAADMVETMYASNGIGLAANQVGLTERIIIVDAAWTDDEDKKNHKKNPIAMINPEVVEEGVEDDVYCEGCLSLPEIEGDVWRPTRIKVRYQTLDGETVERDAFKMEARCIMHELDHLNGVLFIDRMATDDRLKLAAKLNKLRKSRLKAMA